MGIGLVAEYLKEFSGAVMFLVGIMLLILGLLLLNRFGSLISAVGFFFGIILVAFSFFVQLGLFSGNLRSLDGLGTILLCLSVVLFAFSIAIIQFLSLNVIGFVQEIFRGRVSQQYKVIYSSERPYGWLSVLSLEISLVSLAAGLAIKAFYVLKS